MILYIIIPSHFAKNKRFDHLFSHLIMNSKSEKIQILVKTKQSRRKVSINMGILDL